MDQYKFIRNTILKALLIFLVLNIIFIEINDYPFGNISLYNILFEGRDRFPFGENPEKSYNLTLNNLDAMFSSLKINKKVKNDDEFRVFLIGDSSVWGILLDNQNTISGQINQLSHITCEGKKLQAYNLGYPTLSLFKDMMIINRSLSYAPDLIVWLVTLESFPMDSQLSSPILANDPKEVQFLVDKYQLVNNIYSEISLPDFFSKTIIGQRRNLFDLIRLQLYGVMWSSTGIDQYLPTTYSPAMRDFDKDYSFHQWQPHLLPEDELAFNIIEKISTSLDTPLIIINEPILISRGENSHIRYNYYYPRWAYDQYRVYLQNFVDENRLKYYDLWDLVAEEEFTNSAIHMTPSGVAKLSNRLIEIIDDSICLNN